MDANEGIGDGKRPGGRPLISQRTAVVTISILLCACAAGWLLTEFIPPDLPYRREMFRQRWGDTAVSLVESLRLYDPFHSFWFSGTLALFFVVLLLCLISRGNRMTRMAFGIRIPDVPSGGGGRLPRFEIETDGVGAWSNGGVDPVSHYGRKHGKIPEITPDKLERLLRTVRGAFAQRRYSFAARTGDRSAVFAAVSGRAHNAGNLLFHVGLLVITVGGVIGSRMGSMEMLYGKRGDILPLGRDGTTLRVDDFRIIMSDSRSVKDYVTEVTLLDPAGETAGAASIEVNQPLRYRGYSIYQSSFYVAEDEFEWARLRVALPDTATSAEVMLAPGSREQVPGIPLAISAGRFLPDFRMTGSGPRSVSSSMNNPALEVVVGAPGGGESGWIFLFYPDFNSRFSMIKSIVLEDIEPSYYSGLQVSRNPGAATFLAGMIMAAAGLALLYFYDYRLVHGTVSGSGIAITGVAARWRVAFRVQLESIARDIRRAVEGGGGQ